VSPYPVRQVDIIKEPVATEVSEDWLNFVVDQALRVALADDQAGQVSLLLTDDATVRDLNREYRGLDEVTDVLSFSAEFPGHWEGPDGRAPSDGRGPENFPFVLPPEQVTPLGEVIVSYPQAQRQSSDQGHDLKMELALLIVHGLLHLVGHDHLEEHDTAVMQARERLALQSIFQPVIFQPGPVSP
jgi:probable rRNA maturation factor